MFGQKVLLLNSSNADKFPVYPYAFIQVPAIARQSGIEAICKDMLGIPHERWKQTIQTLIEKHNPAMILITLRNTDSLDSTNYERDNLNRGNQNAYFPIERTRELITAIREISDLKIALGGFGFSLLPDELMRYLRPDFGVYEGPNDFFAHFEEVKNGNLDKVVNLLFFQDGQLISNPRKLYPPLADAEYTPQAIEAMLEFYAAFPSPGFQGAPVEVIRGCNHSCVFCAEPHSKGAQVRYRELSAVMKDIEILVNHGVTRLYIVSSELNPEGNEFVLELADMIRSFNESQAEDRKITWYGANYLLKFESDEYERLYRSGFTGGWFDITALDDENARAMQTPYRNTRLLTYLKIYVEQQKKQINLLLTRKARGSDVKIRAGGGREDELIRWTMFLGNPATTIETIRNTLRIANLNGLPNLFDSCDLIDHIRVFDYEELDEATIAATYSVTLDLKRTSYQQLLPSFAYPPALLRDFSEEEISEMFNHIAETYLSKKYQQTRDWHGFVNQKATAASISRWMAELSNIKEMHLQTHLGHITGESVTLHELFTEKSQEEEILSDASQVARKMVDFIVSTCLEIFPDFFESLDLPSTANGLDRTTPYELALSVFSRWELAAELATQTRSTLPEWKHDLLQFCVHAILYRYNILLKPKYRQLFISV
jgi:pyruvate-formate lyase-activating enzyme